MRLLTERFAEMPTTDVRYARIVIRIEHPDLPESRSFALMQDVRLMDFVAIRKPLDNASERELRDFFERRGRRERLVDALATQVAYAMYATLDEVEKP